MKMKNKFILIGLILATCTTCLCQNNILRGVVVQQNSGKRTLSGVKITTFGGNSTYSDSNGHFEIKYQNKNAGDNIILMCEKNGFEVINEKELESVIIRKDPDDIVKISMCNIGERNKLALQYYNIILENTNKRIDSDLKELNRKVETLSNNEKEKELLFEQINSLIMERDSWVLKAENLAQQLSEINTDELSSLRKKSFDNFLSGNIQDALDVVSDEKLDKFYHDALDKKIKADSLLKEAITNYIYKADLCLADLRFLDAEKNFIKALNIDSLNYSVVDKLILFYLQYSPEKALNLINKITPYFEKDEYSSKRLDYMSAIAYLQNKQDFQKAEQLLVSAKNYYIPLSIDYPKKYIGDVSNCYYYLGLIAIEKQDFNSAKDYFHKAETGISNTDKFKIQIYIQHILTCYLSQDDDCVKSNLIKLDEIIPIIYENNNKMKSYYNHVACNIKDLFVSESQENKCEGTKELNSFQISKVVLNGLKAAKLMLDQKYKLACDKFIENLSLIENLNGISEHQKNYYKLVSMQSLPFLFRSEKDFVNAVKYCQEYIEFTKSLTEQVSIQYKVNLADAYHDFARVYDDQKDSVNAVTYYYKAVSILDSIKEDEKFNRIKVLEELSDLYRHMAWFYHYDFSNSNVAYELNTKSIEYAQQCFEEIPNEYYRKELSNAYLRSGFIAFNGLKNDKYSIYNYENALIHLEKLIDNKPARKYKKDKLESLESLAKCYLQIKSYRKATEYIPEALSLSDEIGWQYNKVNLLILGGEIYSFIDSDSSSHYSLQAIRMNEEYFTKSNSYCDELSENLTKIIDYSSKNNTIYSSSKITERIFECRKNIDRNCDLKIEENLTKLHVLDSTIFNNPQLRNDIDRDSIMLMIEIWHLSQYQNRIERYVDKISHLIKMTKSIDKWQKQFNNEETYRRFLSTTKGNLSFYYLFAEKFKLSEIYALEGINLNKDNDWINTNLALSYLYQNNWKKAKEIYLTFKNKPYQDTEKLFKDIFISDLEELKNYGLECKYYNIALSFLNE